MANVNLGHVVGEGVPSGGTAGQILKKSSATNFETEWANPEELPAISTPVADFAAPYSSSTTYQEGDYSTKDGQLYKHNSWGGSTPAAESWDATHWTAVTMTGELNAEKAARAAADTANATEIGAAEAGLAIVINGDTAPQAISSGQYLFIKNHSTLATGGYHATAAIASGATISSSNVAADADGIANAINDQMAKLPICVILTRNSITQSPGIDNWSIAGFPPKTGYIRRIIAINPSTSSILFCRTEDSVLDQITVYLNNTSNSSVTFNLEAIGMYIPTT